jgi:hypothetical protein
MRSPSNRSPACPMVRPSSSGGTRAVPTWAPCCRRRRRARQPQRHVPGQRRTRHAVAAYIPGSW